MRFGEPCIPRIPNSAATYNNGDADGDPNPQVPDSDPAPYTGDGKDGKTAIHWENTTQQALQKCLAQGYESYGNLSCAAELHLSQNNSDGELLDGAWAKTLMPFETGIPIHSVKFSILPFLPDLLLRRR